MPELCEVEYYRRAAEGTVGRTVSRVQAGDAWYCKGETTPAELERRLPGRRIDAARRRGKLLLLDLDDGTTLGLRFGMTGRLIVDGIATIDQLEYDSATDDPRWDRFALGFDAGGHLTIRDSRRLGGVELDPNDERLGPDARTLSEGDLLVALSGARTAVKARLLDQSRIAGLGNLLTDEILWRAGVDPGGPAAAVGVDRIERLAEVIRDTVEELLAAGGSHRGTLQSQRRPDGRCPRCDVALDRRTIGGRTTYSCPRHQN